MVRALSHPLIEVLVFSMRTVSAALFARLGVVVAAAVADPAVLRVGVIGTGCIGIEHLKNLNLVSGVEIKAIADNFAPSREAGLACLRKLGVDLSSVSVHEDYTELLASPDVDAVVICTPNDHHIDVLRYA